MSFPEAFFGNVLQHIDNNLGLYAFLSLIPLIIIYLIKPQPYDKTIPSLMFFLKELNKMKRYRYLKYFLREMLFLFHVILLLLLATTITQPFVLTKEDLTAEYTVLVLDISASTQTKQIFGTRFDKIVDKAKDYLEGKISIILSGNEPLIVLENGDSSDAREILSKLTPQTTLSSLGKSILAAGDLLKENKGKIVVISDFVNTDEVDPYIAKKTLEAKDKVVIFEDVKSTAKNVGIVGARYTDDQTFLEVQNYNDNPMRVEVKAGTQRYTVDVAPQWIETVSIKNQPGINTAKLDINDDFPLDNSITISIPTKKQVKILIISNKPVNYIQNALLAYKEIWNSEAQVEIARPPVLPVINHDIIIINDIDKDKMPKANLDRIMDLVEDGATLVVTAQDDITNTPMNKHLPIDIIGKGSESPVYNTRKLLSVTQDIAFDKVKSYFKAKPQEDSVVLARTEDDSPIIAMKAEGKGKVVFVGFLDQQSNFKFSVSYPLFWQQLIDYIIGLPKVEDLNHKIGEKLILDSVVDVVTPRTSRGKEQDTTIKTLKTQELLLDEIGVYEIGQNKVAVNLLNKLESNVNFENEGIADKSYDASKFNVQVKKNITEFLIYAIIAILFLELFYVKIRGDM